MLGIQYGLLSEPSYCDVSFLVSFFNPQPTPFIQFASIEAMNLRSSRMGEQIAMLPRGGKGA